MRIPNPPKNKNSLIPQYVAEQKEKLEPESKPFILSFEKYNEKMCEIQNLTKNCPKKLVLDLKKIGKHLSSIKQFSDNGIDMKPVRNEGEYKKLFNGLHPDVDLYQHKLQGTARLFYYLYLPERIFFIVCIRHNHLETNKTRR